MVDNKINVWVPQEQLHNAKIKFLEQNPNKNGYNQEVVEEALKEYAKK